MSVADDIEAYAAYINAWPRAKVELGDDELAEFAEDMDKAHAAMLDSYYGITEELTNG